MLASEQPCGAVAEAGNFGSQDAALDRGVRATFFVEGALAGLHLPPRQGLWEDAPHIIRVGVWQAGRRRDSLAVREENHWVSIDKVQLTRDFLNVTGRNSLPGEACFGCSC